MAAEPACSLGSGIWCGEHRVVSTSLPAGSCGASQRQGVSGSPLQKAASQDQGPSWTEKWKEKEYLVSLFTGYCSEKICFCTIVCMQDDNLLKSKVNSKEISPQLT